MIAIIDYGMGNVGSIKNMLKHINIEALITDDPKTILSASHLILPGVGAYDAGVNNLKAKKLDLVIKEFALELNKPVLGICLGMQLLGNKSEEGKLKGLGLIDFENIKFSKELNLKIPNMGWNYIKVMDKDDPLTKEILDDDRFYFVHSYYAVCKNKENILMTADYGLNYTASVRKNKIYGVQFHPEKSHYFGMKILRNFALEV